VKVGSHEGGHLPFAFEITEQLAWDAENIVAISVENELKPTRVPSGNMQSAFSMLASALPTTFDFFPFAGIHRPVVLYTVPQTHIEDVTVVTDIDGTTGRISASVRLNEAVHARGTITLRGAAEPLTDNLHFAAGVAAAELRVPNARFWSDKDPFFTSSPSPRTPTGMHSRRASAPSRYRAAGFCSTAGRCS